MERDLLAQDYLLKQLTASLIYPEREWGEKFWEEIYTKAYEKYGTTDIPVDTFNKVWIIPNKAVVYENGNSVFVIENYLKVLLEEDYLALEGNRTQEIKKRNQKGVEGEAKNKKKIQQQENHAEANIPDVPGYSKSYPLSSLSSKIIKDVIIPVIEKEVNQGKNFASLRQVYNSMLLATWYKRNLKASLLNSVYSDQNKVIGIDLKDKHIHEKIYQQYLTAFQKGVFNYIREDYDSVNKRIIERKYFSGGTHGYNKTTIQKIESLPNEGQDLDHAMVTQQRANPLRGEEGRLHKVTASLFETNFRKRLSQYLASWDPEEISEFLSEFKKELLDDENLRIYREDIKKIHLLGQALLVERWRSRDINNPHMFTEKVKSLRPRIDQAIKELSKPVARKMIASILLKQSEKNEAEKASGQLQQNDALENSTVISSEVKDLPSEGKKEIQILSRIKSSLGKIPGPIVRLLIPSFFLAVVFFVVDGITQSDRQPLQQTEGVSSYWYSPPAEKSDIVNTPVKEKEKKYISLDSPSKTTRVSADGKKVREMEKSEAQSKKTLIAATVVYGEHLEKGETFFTGVYANLNPGGQWTEPLRPKTITNLDMSKKTTLKVQVPDLKAGETTDLLWNLKWTPQSIDDPSARVKLVSGNRIQALKDINAPYRIQYNLFPVQAGGSRHFSPEDMMQRSSSVQREWNELDTNPHLAPIRHALGNPSSFADLLVRFNQVVSENMKYNAYFNFRLNKGDTFWGAFAKVLSAGEEWRTECDTGTSLAYPVFTKYGYSAVFAKGWMYHGEDTIGGSVGHTVMIIDTKSPQGLVIYDITQHLPLDEKYEGQFTEQNKQTRRQDSENSTSDLANDDNASNSAFSDWSNSIQRYFQQRELTDLEDKQDAQGLETYTQDQDNFFDLRKNAIDALAQADAYDNILNLVIEENLDQNLRTHAFNVLK